MRLGIGGIVVVGLLSLVFRQNFFTLRDTVPVGPATVSPPGARRATPAEEQERFDVVPDSFTHGSSAPRVEWFTRGLQSGDPCDCDTLGGAREAARLPRRPGLDL